MRFLRSISDSLGKRIKVIKPNGEDKTYSSLLDMPATDRREYIMASMDSSEIEMGSEQYAFVRASIKNMMIENARGCLKH